MESPIGPNFSLICSLILGLIPNSYLRLKIKPNSCRHSKNVRKLGLTPMFLLKQVWSFFYKVSQNTVIYLSFVDTMMTNKQRSSVCIKLLEVHFAISQISTSTGMRSNDDDEGDTSTFISVYYTLVVYCMLLIHCIVLFNDIKNAKRKKTETHREP